jgi:hypothetical protein
MSSCLLEDPRGWVSKVWKSKGRWGTYVDGEGFQGIGCPFRYQDADGEGKNMFQRTGELEKNDCESNG